MLANFGDGVRGQSDTTETRVIFLHRQTQGKADYEKEIKGEERQQHKKERGKEF